jgi:hypothetical protein
MPLSAGPVASLKGLWHDAQFDMNIAFPSGAAIAEMLLNSSTMKKDSTLR